MILTMLSPLQMQLVSRHEINTLTLVCAILTEII